MGVIVDTSTLVIAERRKHSAGEVFGQLRDVCGDSVIGKSVVTLVELIWKRTVSSARRLWTI